LDQPLKSSLARVDLVRLDHFRASEAYWKFLRVPVYGRRRALVLGPGAAFLDAIPRGIGGLPIVAEDLGDITADVVLVLATDL